MRRRVLVGHYKSNVRDLEFNLFEVLGLEAVLQSGQFGDLDGEAAGRGNCRHASQRDVNHLL